MNTISEFIAVMCAIVFIAYFLKIVFFPDVGDTKAA